MSRTVFERVETYNHGRDTDLLATKYREMTENAFRFFRGTCHLFYEDLSKKIPAALNAAPLVWICGDAHLENFGTYKGDDREVYFDLNDFDEGVLAPATWEVARLLTSIHLGAKDYGVAPDDEEALCYHGIDEYITALKRGKAFAVEHYSADGLIKDLFDDMQERTREKFLDKRTERDDGTRTFKFGKKALELPATLKKSLLRFFEEWASTQPNPDFYKPIDAAFRIAGTGSVGIQRYMFLVEGKGSPDGNYILDMKEALPSSLAPYVNGSQPDWTNEAERIVAIQTMMQYETPALLSPVSFNGKSFVLKELQPSQDKVDMHNWDGKLERLSGVIGTMCKVLAWSQLRSSGRRGSADADTLIAFADNAESWKDILYHYAKDYSEQVASDYQDFCAALPKEKE
jgi:uncharacterized protein (DUF2252 family)